MKNELSDEDLQMDEESFDGEPDKSDNEEEGSGEEDQAEKEEGTEVSEDGESSEGGTKETKKRDEKKVKVFDERYFEVEDEPPKLVVVQGPPGSGKTTLIKCLIKHYTKQIVQDPKGIPSLLRTDHCANGKEAEDNSGGVS